MLRKNNTSNNLPRPLQPRLKKDENQLGIMQIDTIKNHHSKNLILLLSGNQLDYSDAYAFMKGSRLILEAPLPFYYNDSLFKTHLIRKRSFENYRHDNPDIGFSEIILKPGYYYKVVSCNVLNPGLIKIVLSYKKTDNYYENHKIN